MYLLIIVGERQLRQLTSAHNLFDALIEPIF